MKLMKREQGLYTVRFMNRVYWVMKSHWTGYQIFDRDALYEGKTTFVANAKTLEDAQIEIEKKGEKK